jgi:hypothetical protein
MVRRGVATTAIVAVVGVVLVGATVFGYMLLVPSTQHPSTTQSRPSSVSTAAAPSASATSLGDLKISNAALSNGSILVTVQNTGSQAASLDSLLVTPGSGCLSSAASSTTSQTSQNRSGFALPTCFSGAAVFLVQSNSTLTPAPLGRFNFTRAFNSTSFSRTFSGNFSRTFSGNFSRTISGNFTRGFPGNFTGIFPGGFLGNLTGIAGYQLAAGQAVTLAYSGPIGSGVATGSQYTITVVGLQGEAQITIQAS